MITLPRDDLEKQKSLTKIAQKFVKDKELIKAGRVEELLGQLKK